MADRRIPSWLRAVLPWVLTIVLLALVFWKVDIRKTLGEFHGANLGLFIPATIVFSLYVFFINSLVYTLVVNWFCGPVKYSEVLAIRGASYLLTALNTGAGQGGMILWLSRKKNFPVRDVVSAAIMLPVADISFVTLALTIPMCAHLIVGGILPENTVHILGVVLAVLWGILLLHFGFWSARGSGFGKRLRESPWLRSYREATAKQYFKLLGLRFIQHVPGMMCFYVALLAFGLHVPLASFVVRFFPALIIQSLPATVAQLGTAQVGWITMFGDIVGKDHINALIAYTLSWSFMYLITRALIGVFFFRGEMRKFFRGQKRKEAEEAGTMQR